jgi:hypothetical protein
MFITKLSLGANAGDGVCRVYDAETRNGPGFRQANPNPRRMGHVIVIPDMPHVEE